jgi:hypothetical protein
MCGCRFSKHVKIWAKNAFDECNGSLGMNLSIIDLLKKEESVKGFVDTLCLFVLQVAKKDDIMYLSTKYFFLLLLLLFSNLFVYFLSHISCI